MSEDILQLAKDLGIPLKRVESLRAEYQVRFKDNEKGEAKLLEWLKECWEEVRDRNWLLSAQGSSYVVDAAHPTSDGDERHYGYTETPFQADLDAGEAPPPDQVGQYRESRQARDRFQAEQMDEVGELMAAMRLVRSSLDALPADKKASASRHIWAFKGRMDALEREIRRRLAA